MLSSIYAIESLSAVESFPNTKSGPFHRRLFSVLKPFLLLLHFVFSLKEKAIKKRQEHIFRHLPRNPQISALS
jgi:hypothetical protein